MYRRIVQGQLLRKYENFIKSNAFFLSVEINIGSN